MFGLNTDMAVSLYRYSRAQEHIDSALKDRGFKSGEELEKEPLVSMKFPEHSRTGCTEVLTSMLPKRNRTEPMGV